MKYDVDSGVMTITVRITCASYQDTNLIFIVYQISSYSCHICNKTYGVDDYWFFIHIMKRDEPYVLHYRNSNCKYIFSNVHFVLVEQREREQQFILSNFSNRQQTVERGFHLKLVCWLNIHEASGSEYLNYNTILIIRNRVVNCVH